MADAVRDLIDATIRTTVDDDEVRAVHAELERAGRPAPGRASCPDQPVAATTPSDAAWHWGNAVIGAHNAIAPPMTVIYDEHGRAHADIVLGAAYEGPPGLVHGGVTAMMLDHLMGETASGMRRPTFTGTLTMRYRRGTPLGPLHLEGHIDREEGRKVFVVATISDAEGVTVEADGVFIEPRTGHAPRTASDD